MKEIQIKNGLVAKVESIYDNFDASKTSADVRFISSDEDQVIRFVMSDEFIEDTFGHRGEITDELRENTLSMLIRRVDEEKSGIPKNVQTVLALKVNMPLMYRAHVDMQNQS